MELWIRSQDREKLVRPTNLKIEYENELYVILSKCNYRYRLGYYKTKERALEVLDETQKLLKPKIYIKGGKIVGSIDDNILKTPDEIEIKEFNTYVYEMPLE